MTFSYDLYIDECLIQTINRTFCLCTFVLVAMKAEVLETAVFIGESFGNCRRAIFFVLINGPKFF